ncbi:SKP1-like protein 1B [Arachis hypogaea]|nr:SKP1-like protein 1B [Arachis hypogaea]
MHAVEAATNQYHSNTHWFSWRISSSSSRVKSFLILNVLQISSEVLLDHVCHCLASKIQEVFDVQVVFSQNEIEEHGLIDLNEFSIPHLEILLGWLLLGSSSIDVLLAIFNHLRKDLAGGAFEVDEAVALESQTIKHMIQDDYTEIELID